MTETIHEDKIERKVAAEEKKEESTVPRSYEREFRDKETLKAEALVAKWKKGNLTYGDITEYFGERGAKGETRDKFGFTNGELIDTIHFTMIQEAHTEELITRINYTLISVT